MASTTGRARRRARSTSLIANDPLWYKDAVIYELHVKSFYDSDGDGIGDFPGLTSKLGYLQELGVTALWLLPFYPSPLRDDGYDIADYSTVNPTYGTLDDFREFLEEAHKRGLRVITELVINHTSDQHPWFRRARLAPRGSPERDFYVWTDDPTTYGETRIIFKDYEPSNWTWDSVAGQYYWHRFFHHQPDLNFDNPAVHEQLFAAMDQWWEMGVDGMRLDAIPYLYEREGTNCENLPDTHVFLKKLRAHVDKHHDGKMLLAEANQWPEDAARYFGEGDECHMNFHFPIMPRLFMSLRMEDRFPIVDILEQTPQIPENAQWAIFLRNHDELTLEMVTDEERDYMYRVYAMEHTARINLGIRRRLSPLLEKGRRRIELMNSLLFALPGTPVLYYGDEIGMGDNIYLGDRHGVRTPMQWSADKNAGFSRANPQRLFLPLVIEPEYHYESVNVEAQHANPSSLLWWMRRLIALRRQHHAFGRGTLEWVSPENKHVLAFVRAHGTERILVVVNLSRFAQAASLDLSKHAGTVPVEMFGRTPFPPVDEEPYRLTLGPHNFLWFLLQERVPATPGRTAAPPAEAHKDEVAALPRLEVRKGWEEVLEGSLRGRLESELARWIVPRRWFGGKSRRLRELRIEDSVPVPLDGAEDAQVLLVRVTYLDEEPDRYVIPLGWVPDDPSQAGPHPPEGARTADGYRSQLSAICRLAIKKPGGTTEGLLVEASGIPAFARALLAQVTGEARHEGGGGELVGLKGALGRVDLSAATGDDQKLRVISGEQSNTSMVYGDRGILKLFRKVEEGVNLDRELTEHLTRSGFPHTPEVAGAIEYRSGRGGITTVALLQGFVPNQGDAWGFTLDALERYFESSMASPFKAATAPLPGRDLMAAARRPLPVEAHRLIEEAYLDAVLLLGRRTGEMHRALATGDSVETKPELFTSLYQRSIYQSMRNLVGRTLRMLQQGLGQLSGADRERAESILAQRDTLLAAFRTVLERKLEGQRIRIHGDYHLGQVLYTGKDFAIIDFEGEPARPLSERRLKRSPLRDVAGMLRSFHYASVAALFREQERGVAAEGRMQALEEWARFWTGWVSASFLRGYLDAVDDAAFLPAEDRSRQMLLDVFLLEKALYELGYELDNRPTWMRIPVQGILDLIGPEKGA
jgi:maltose alpha-D-glucosyltransferase/alpha-amylase